MKRAILVPAVLVPDALDELKSWLSIGTPREDAMLAGLLQAALATCESFTRQMPIEATCEEVFRTGGDWHALDTCPVLAVTGVDHVGDDGARFALDPTSYELDFTEEGGARIRLLAHSGSPRVAVRFVAGLASTWSALPDPLRHGIVRLAAHLYRQRDSDAASGIPPASVAALWSAWRRMRLA